MFEELILVPYRNRKKQLDFFINNIVPMLNELLPSSRVIIVEQTQEELFNRGALLNAGALIYAGKYKDIITHDVDLYPKEHFVIKYYRYKFNGALGLCCSPCNTLGGVVKVPEKFFTQIGGFPNHFWGWGIEDKAFQNRIEIFNIPIQKIVLRNRPGFTENFDFDEEKFESKKDSFRYLYNYRIQYEKWPTLSKARQMRIINNSGLNNLKLRVIRQNSYKDFDHCVIKLDRNFFQRIFSL